MTDEEQKDILSVNNNDVFNNNNFDIDKIPWIISKYVFENNQEHGYKLHKGDVFKLGKYILRVRELGIDDDKKPFFFENKNTQKFVKNRSINNLSQMPLNQGAENHFSALNLNQIINVQRKEDNKNNGQNEDNNNENSNSHSSSNNRNDNGGIQIIQNGSENNNSHSENISNVNSFNNNLNHANNNNSKKKYNSLIHLSKKKQ